MASVGHVGVSENKGILMEHSKQQDPYYKDPQKGTPISETPMYITRCNVPHTCEGTGRSRGSEGHRRSSLCH